jgi:adenylate cyclase
VPQEIERKFLVANDGWRREADGGRKLRQAYLAETERAAIRVRIIDDSAAFITIKSARTGLSRPEFEYSVPLSDARELAELRRGSELQKTRFRALAAGRCWEIDVYDGDNAGLVLAEVELESEDASVEIPSWVGQEVTGEQRYYAAKLAAHPFRSWGDNKAGRSG